MQARRRGAEHPIKLVVREQGRTLTWLARTLEISANYLHRLLLPPEHPDSRPEPDWFYAKASLVLGVPESMLRPAWAETGEMAA